MIAIFGAALAVGVIAACIGPFYYCKKSKQEQDESETIQDGSTSVHIKVSRPLQDQHCSETLTDQLSTRRASSIDSNGRKEMGEVVREEGPVSSNEAETVPPRAQRRRRRVPTRIWSPTLRDQLEDITNSSTEMCGTTTVVRAQIETRPESTPCNYANYRRGSFNDSTWRDGKTRKPSAVARGWKNLKRALICPRAVHQSTLCNDLEIDDSQGIDIPLEPQNQRSPPEHSGLLRNNDLVDVSTSTRISTNVSNARTLNDETTVEPCNPKDNIEPSQKQSQEDGKPIVSAKTEMLQEIVSLIKRQSINGKSVCDVRISGLALNQNQLLDLFQANEGKSRSASFVTTEDASLVSMKFHRRRSSGDAPRTNSSSFHVCPLRKLYRTLPEILEDLSISKLFRWNEAAQVPDRAASSIRVANKSRTTNFSENDTTYLAFPKVTKEFVTDESRFSRTGTLSRRHSNDHMSRFFEERRI